MNATPPLPPFAVIGLGPLGGAIIRGLSRVFPEAQLVAIDSDPKARAQAIRDRLLPSVEESPGQSLASCGLVFLCVPIRELPSLLPQLANHLGEEAIVTDVAPVMRPVESLMAEHLPRVRFVGGHPLVAGDLGGQGQQLKADPFVGRPIALCPKDGEEHLAAGVGTVWAALGARPVVLSSEQHDRLIAATAHAPYLASLAMARLAGSIEGAERLVAKAFGEAVRPAGLPAEAMAAAVAANPFAPAAARVLASELIRLADLAERDPDALHDAAKEGREAWARLLSE